jgi:signal transduction histidine kinase/CheY-like chemotaxis protein
MVTANSPYVSLGNNLLAALPEHEYRRLLPDLQRVELTCGQVLYQPGEEIQYTYFPLNSVICLMALMENGSNIGVGIVGKEGMVGLPLFLGSNTAPNQALVEIGGSAIRMRAGVFRKASEESGFNSLLHLYTQAVLTQAAQAAACNRFHTIRPALANWLLSIHDRTGGVELRITHEQISTMMGVRRAGVTNATLQLQDEGLIRGTRGLIRVIDRQGLEAAACECYELVKKEFNRLAAETPEVTKVMWNGIERRDGVLNHKRDLQKLLEVNSRLLIAGIREQEARDQAEEANKAKDEFLATLSHELRTPLTAMLGWTRILRTTKLDEVEFVRALETIERSAQAQTQLIEDMLDVSRIVAGKLALQTRQLNLSSIIQTGIDVVRPMAESKQIQLNYTCDSRIDSLTGDPKRLQQVVLNLLTNAIKFTPRTGRVEVCLSRVNQHAEITVRDTGEGIASDLLPHVFDRFRQGNGVVRKQSAGLGLGLAIVQHLVQLHGGNVRAESAGQQQGATFTVELPLTVDEAQARDTAKHSGLTNSRTVDELECPGTLNGLRLLVVEDDADTRELITFILEQCGAVVTSVTSVREALDVLAHSKIDVLLSDIGLSDADGYELIRQVRLMDNEDGRNIPAVALTACATAEDRRRALSAGFQCHLPKPVEPTELTAVLSRLAAAI